MLEVALEEPRSGLAEGGIPIGAALFSADGKLPGTGPESARPGAGSLASWRDRRVSAQWPAAQLPGHGDGHDAGAVLVLQRAGAPVRDPKGGGGESVTFSGGIDWLRECGVEVVDLASKQCIELLAGFIAAHPELWHEDIGQR
jgi:cytosine/creatinine deaminase